MLPKDKSQAIVERIKHMIDDIDDRLGGPSQSDMREDVKSRSALVQCLREIDPTQPFYYHPKPWGGKEVQGGMEAQETGLDSLAVRYRDVSSKPFAITPENAAQFTDNLYRWLGHVNDAAIGEFGRGTLLFTGPVFHDEIAYDGEFSKSTRTMYRLNFAQCSISWNDRDGGTSRFPFMSWNPNRFRESEGGAGPLCAVGGWRVFR